MWYKYRMNTTRRNFLAGIAGTAAVASSLVRADDAPPATAVKRSPNRIGLASYSLWQFTHNEHRELKKNLDLAAEWGFAGIEVLERQLGPEHEKDKTYLQGVKRHAALNGLDLYGMATHQTFLTPDADKRKANVDLTIGYIELAYSLGIPTMRVQTGTWGTSKDFDDLMAHRGIEPPLPGHTDEEAFKWVVDCFGQCVAVAEKCGVTMGLENHWGLGRTPQGVKRIIESVNSPLAPAHTCDDGEHLLEASLRSKLA